MNTDDAIFGTGYFVLAKSKKINAAIRGRNSLLTEWTGTRCLALAGAEFNHSGANKAGQIQWAKDGSLTPEEVDMSLRWRRN